MSLWTGRRRFHLQLTPLLDLLLIVIFAQYLDVQQQARRQSVEVEQQASARERQLTQRYAALESNLERERKSLAQEREALSSREQEAARRVEQISQQLEDVLEQQRRAADVVAELFNVPQELIDETLKPQPTDAPPRAAPNWGCRPPQFQAHRPPPSPAIPPPRAYSSPPTKRPPHP